MGKLPWEITEYELHLLNELWQRPSATVPELAINAGPETVRRTPLWNREWILAALLTLLGVEWFWRRWLGLA